MRAGGKNFSMASTLIAASGTRKLIAFLPLEDNRLARWAPESNEKDRVLLGEENDSPVEYTQANP